MSYKGYYTVMCSECHKYFAMQWIKSDYKTCPACGKRVKWRVLKKKMFPSMNEAQSLALHLNEKAVDTRGSTLGELLRKHGK